MHSTQHPLGGKIVFLRLGGKTGVGPACSVRLIDWLDRLEREIDGLDSYTPERMYLTRRKPNDLPDDDEIAIGMCQDDEGPHLLVFHQKEIVTYEGHPDFENILAESEPA